MRFRLGKAEVRLSIGVLPLFAALLILGEGRALAYSALSLLLHECAHAIAAKNLGFGLRRISIWPFGAVMHLEPFGSEPNSEWIVSLAGPLGSFVIASCVRLFAHALPAYAEALDPFARTNAAIALFNLLPAYPLDGGRLSKALLLRVLDERHARPVSLGFTGAIAALLIALGVFCVRKGLPAWTLFLIAPYLMCASWIEWKRVTPKTVAYVLNRQSARRAGGAIRAQIVCIDGNATVGTAMQALSHRYFTILRIQNGERSIEADENALLIAASRCGYDTALKDIFAH